MSEHYNSVGGIHIMLTSLLADMKLNLCLSHTLGHNLTQEAVAVLSSVIMPSFVEETSVNL